MGRNKSIDIVKGIGIITVVIGHIYTGALKEVIYTFHMPLFFFISGYLFNNKKKLFKDNLLLIKKKLVSLMLPYFVYLFILRPYNFFKHDLSDSITYFEVSVFGGQKLSGVYWFITVLFFTYLVAYLLLKYFSDTVIVVISLSMLIISYLNIRMQLPWNIQVVLQAFPFFVVGNYFKKYEERFTNILLIILALLIIILGYKFIQNISYDMKYSKYGVPGFSFIYALLFIYLLKELSIYISKWANISLLLENLGKISMTIMYWHLIVINYFKDKLGATPNFVVVIFAITIPYALHLVFTRFTITRFLLLGNRIDNEKLI